MVIVVKRLHLVELLAAQLLTPHLWLAVQLQQPEALPAGCLWCWPLSPAQRRRAAARWRLQLAAREAP